MLRKKLVNKKEDIILGAVGNTAGSFTKLFLTPKVMSFLL